MIERRNFTITSNGDDLVMFRIGSETFFVLVEPQGRSYKMRIIASDNVSIDRVKLRASGGEEIAVTRVSDDGC